MKSGCGETRGESKWVRNGLTEGVHKILRRAKTGPETGPKTGRLNLAWGFGRASKFGFRKSCGERRGSSSGSESLAHKQTGAKNGSLTCHPRFRRWGSKTGPRTGPRTGSPFLADRRGCASTKIKGVKGKTRRQHERRRAKKRERERESKNGFFGGFKQGEGCVCVCARV